MKVNIEVGILDPTIEAGDLEAVVSGPEGYRIPSSLRRSAKGASVSFVPIEPGTYKVTFASIFYFLLRVDESLDLEFRSQSYKFCISLVSSNIG